MNIGIILAGGIGSRFKSKKPKQYMKLNGKEVIEYSVNAFKKSKEISDIICVVDKPTLSEGRIEKKYGIKCVLGGDTRNESLKNALDYINNIFGSVNKVFIHEAARPFIKAELIDKYLNLLEDFDAVVTAVEITDSLAKKNGENSDRSEYHLIQAPECFRFKSIYEDFKAESEITSTSHQLSKDRKINYFYDFGTNLKITYPNDLFLAEQIMKYTYLKQNSLKEQVENKNSCVLLLGSTGGVGSKVKERLATAGVDVIAPSRAELNLESISVSRLYDLCAGRKPDAIVNCAAYSVDDAAGLLEEFETTFLVNVKSNLVLLEYAKELDRRVNIVFLSSSSSTRGRKNITLYSASKAAVNSIVESQAESLREKKIYLNAIIPEKINTPLIQKLHKKDIDEIELLQVDDVVDAVIHYSETDEYGKLTHLRCGL